ncbi:hypothetical protein [Nocardiopsis ansamitocini]|uniref:DUF4190 domain-containing protein n=1 Tax=Nocardiopsis ansamitocini TaxID=1670832 RepID=A0A9W6P5F7_9ACTN|nr:hypothetical protein [Nocardiopsis ansamitocini]GLU47427.1 hypothetical protein Nans01_17780 [Nocardiopsis ansamitocini]
MSSQWSGPPDYWGDPRQPRPPGWDGGYGQPSGPWQPGYPPPPPPGYGRPPGYPPHPGPPPARGNAILSLIIAIIVTLSCFGFTNIIGIVFAAIALSKEQDPVEFEKYTRWAWLSNFIHIGILILLLVLFLSLTNS